MTNWNNFFYECNEGSIDSLNEHNVTIDEVLEVLLNGFIYNKIKYESKAMITGHKYLLTGATNSGRIIRIIWSKIYTNVLYLITAYDAKSIHINRFKGEHDRGRTHGIR